MGKQTDFYSSRVIRPYINKSHRNIVATSKSGIEYFYFILTNQPDQITLRTNIFNIIINYKSVFIWAEKIEMFPIILSSTENIF